jgi:hypothetical protein
MADAKSVPNQTLSAEAYSAAVAKSAFKVNGSLVFPQGQKVVDATAMMAVDPTRTAVVAETITGGVKDACDTLPEGTIIISP